MRWLVIIGLFGSFVSAQEHLVQTGPFGAPITVDDGMGNSSLAIVVYEDSDVGYVVPDVTSAGWRSWFLPAYAASGTYSVQLYEWFKTTKICASWPHPSSENQQWIAHCRDLGFRSSLITVNTHNHSVHIATSVLVDKDGIDDITTMHVSKSDLKLTETSKTFQTAVDRITKILDNECRGGRGN